MSRVQTRRRVASLVALALSLAPAAARADEAVLYRIFLTDGSALASYGEFARVADKVVFSMPLGGTAAEPRLELVTVPAAKVDWPATERYADAARASHYASTRGETDYARLTAEVAAALNKIAAAPDDRTRLKMAESMRRYIAEWSRESYGYRAFDISQISGMLDELVSELRVANGEQRFELNLVATVGPPPPVPLLPQPTFRESVQQALAAAKHATDSAERTTLLESIARALEGPDEGPDAWRTAMRTRVSSELAAERQVDARYAAIARRSLLRADERSSFADVHGVQTVIAQAMKEDDRLGRRRPGQMSALLTALDTRLEAARRLRLARDRWNERADDYRKYRGVMREAMAPVNRARTWLEDIRALAGPDMKALATLEYRVGVAAAQIGALTPPPGLESVHGLAGSAVQLAGNAVRARRSAISSGDLNTAWGASSAAAGALLLLDRIPEDLERAIQPPTVQR
ncbi:MAG TPA: hypothetical protein VH679_03195 [Vicinamibacterales bacterium]|jgi:hypothetical protein